MDETEDLPRIHIFTKELLNWLTLISIAFFLIYSVLFIIYEIAIDLAHVRWAFSVFLIGCAIDVIFFWICKFAIHGEGSGEKFLLYVVLLSQICTGLFYVIAPSVVLSTFGFSPHVSETAADLIIDEQKREVEVDYDEVFHHTLEDYIDPDPCGVTEDEAIQWECGFLGSIRIATLCMWISAIPKILICYLLIRILTKGR